MYYYQMKAQSKDVILVCIENEALQQKYKQPRITHPCERLIDSLLWHTVVLKVDETHSR